MAALYLKDFLKCCFHYIHLLKNLKQAHEKNLPATTSRFFTYVY